MDKHRLSPQEAQRQLELSQKHGGRAQMLSES